MRLHSKKHLWDERKILSTQSESKETGQGLVFIPRRSFEEVRMVHSVKLMKNFPGKTRSEEGGQQRARERERDKEGEGGDLSCFSPL